MADKEEGKCSSSAGCRCCGCKAIIALVLLLVGAVVGYLVGGHCAYKKGMCPVMGMTEMSAPATPSHK